MFVTVNSYVKAKQGLNRGEFIELLIRIAKSKFVETGKVKQVSSAFKMLIEDFMKPLWPVGRWQELRSKQFWNNEVNDVL